MIYATQGRDGITYSQNPQLYRRVAFFESLFRSSLLGVLFILIALAFSKFVSGLTTITDVTPETVLDLLLSEEHLRYARNSAPLISSVLMALVFFPIKEKTNASASLFTKILGFIAAITLIDIIILLPLLERQYLQAAFSSDLDQELLKNLVTSKPDVKMLLFSQAAALGLMCVFLPIHRAIAPLKLDYPLIIMDQRIRLTLAKIWYLLAVLGINILALYIVNNTMHIIREEPLQRNVMSLLAELKNDAYLKLILAFGFALSTILYWSKALSGSRWTVILRLVVFVGCFMYAATLYQLVENRDILARNIIWMGLLMTGMVPLQRSLT